MGIKKDIPELLNCLKEIEKQASEVSSHIQSFNKQVESKEISTDGGISFLDIKNQLLLEYLMNLSYIVLMKVSGREVCGSPAVLRLVEIRTVLEKMRPIDKKLKYQIDKLVKLATTGGIQSNGNADPLSFKPNLNMLDAANDEVDDE